MLVTEGFSKVAFANFDIAYRHGIRGIHGPVEDAGRACLPCVLPSVKFGTILFVSYFSELGV